MNCYERRKSGCCRSKGLVFSFKLKRNSVFTADARGRRTNFFCAMIDVNSALLLSKLPHGCVIVTPDCRNVVGTGRASV